MFVCATEEGFAVMPGGLAITAADVPTLLSDAVERQQSKDILVTSDDGPVNAFSLMSSLQTLAAFQRVSQSHLAIMPDPQYKSSRTDFFGNLVQVFMVQHPHTELTMTTVDQVLAARKGGGRTLPTLPSAVCAAWALLRVT